MNPTGEPMKWEYKICKHSGRIWPEERVFSDQKEEERLGEQLNQMGSEEWELAAAPLVGGILKLILKRPVC